MLVKIKNKYNPIDMLSIEQNALSSADYYVLSCALMGTDMSQVFGVEKMRIESRKL